MGGWSSIAFPKDRLIYGPMQIEAMIDQEPTISQQLSLWDQRGSRVIRGNLLVIPIEDSFLYVKPVYLVAEEVNIPQLIRVIVIYGNKLAMQPTLDEALAAVFSGTGAPPATVNAAPKQRESLEGVGRPPQPGPEAVQHVPGRAEAGKLG